MLRFALEILVDFFLVLRQADHGNFDKKLNEAHHKMPDIWQKKKELKAAMEAKPIEE